MVSTVQDNQDGGITVEVMAKHGHSNQPESQQVRVLSVGRPACVFSLFVCVSLSVCLCVI